LQPLAWDKPVKTYHNIAAMLGYAWLNAIENRNKQEKRKRSTMSVFQKLEKQQNLCIAENPV
jgi:hypothetical protein